MEKNYMTDTDLMPFGKYKGIAMANVPCHYLIWLYDKNKTKNKAVLSYIEYNREILDNELEQLERQKNEKERY